MAFTGRRERDVTDPLSRGHPHLGNPQLSRDSPGRMYMVMADASPLPWFSLVHADKSVASGPIRIRRRGVFRRAFAVTNASSLIEFYEAL